MQVTQEQLDTALCELEQYVLSHSVVEALGRAGYITVGSLAGATRQGLLRIPNVSVLRVENIAQSLAAFLRGDELQPLPSSVDDCGYIPTPGEIAAEKIRMRNTWKYRRHRHDPDGAGIDAIGACVGRCSGAVVTASKRITRI